MPLAVLDILAGMRQADLARFANAAEHQQSRHGCAERCRADLQEREACRMTTLKEKKHMGRVAQLPCAICSTEPVEVHHIRSGDAAGMGQRASTYLCIPLCPACHRGPRGVHGDKGLLRAGKHTEMSLLAGTIERLI